MRILIHLGIIIFVSLILSLIQYDFTDIPGRFAFIAIFPWLALFYGIFYEFAKVSKR